MMGILDETKFFLKSILSGIISLFVISGVFFLLPFSNPLTVQIFNKIQSDLLPSGVHLIVTNPLSAFIAEIELSILLAFIILFPFFLYKKKRNKIMKASKIESSISAIKALKGFVTIRCTPDGNKSDCILLKI